MVTLNPLAMTVLNLLHEGAAHPYELQQTIQDRYLDQFVKVRAGSLYHTVERLHRLGLIEPVSTGRSGRRPERTVYAITDDGRDEFQDSLRSAIRHPATEYPAFGSAVEMLRGLDPQDAAGLLCYRVIAIEMNLAGLEQAAASLTKRGLDRIKLIEIEYAQAMLNAEMAWVAAVAEDITTGALTWTHLDQVTASVDPTPANVHEGRARHEPT